MPVLGREHANVCDLESLSAGAHLGRASLLLALAIQSLSQAAHNVEGTVGAGSPHFSS